MPTAYAPHCPGVGRFLPDLAGSNLTLWSGSGTDRWRCVRQLRLLRRTHFTMSAIMNGIALHGGFIPYGATFLVFMEYARKCGSHTALINNG